MLIKCNYKKSHGVQGDFYLFYFLFFIFVYCDNIKDSAIRENVIRLKCYSFFFLKEYYEVYKINLIILKQKVLIFPRSFCLACILYNKPYICKYTYKLFITYWSLILLKCFVIIKKKKNTKCLCNGINHWASEFLDDNLS